MRRILVTALLLAAGSAFALLAGGASDEDSGSPSYIVEVRDAFGLIEGADLKVAGVRAGKISSMKLDLDTNNALVGVELTEKGFSPFRKDVECETRPQSLIGEYFIDCQPGNSQEKLEDGAKIPVSQTFSTIAPDLVNNILRLPQRDRLRIILNELGTGVAARGEDLNQAIRRGVPALRETDRLLAILARQSEVIATLIGNADVVIGDLADNKADVGRFVVEARDTAAASAERRVELADTFNKLPGFLAQLRPAMRDLGRVADAQTPALRDLAATSPQLTRLLNNLGPFADASRPAIRSLGDTAAIGRQAIPALRPTVRQLNLFSQKTPELGKNLAIILEDLYDRDRAVERDPRSPGGRGFNGLENILGYVFWQSQAINIFDENGYILKVSVRDNECAAYADANRVRNASQEYRETCSAGLGPTQPGINAPDPSTGAASARSQQSAQAARAERDAAVLRASQQAAGAPPQPGAGGVKRANRSGASPIDLDKTIGSLLGGATPAAPAGKVAQGVTGAAGNGETTAELLDYLFAP